MKEAEKLKNLVELDAYARAIPKLVIGAEIEAYKAKKGKIFSN